MLCGHLDLLQDKVLGGWSSPLAHSAAALPVLRADLRVAEASLSQKEVISLAIGRSKLSF